MIKKLLCIIGCISLSSLGFSQYYHTPHINVENISSPFSGGYNSCHIAQIDLNFDQIDDLLIFDKIGERITAYITQKDGSYLHQKDFELNLDISSWIQCVDYNRDGKKDLFTYNGVGGIKVYKNISSNGHLQFELIHSAIAVKMFNQTIALYCTNVDFPSFVDINGDDKVDILNFWVATAGDFLHYYQNISTHTDSLLFAIQDWSWGCFVESSESNHIYLDSCKMDISTASYYSVAKHTGSSLFALKQTKSNLYDLLIGDIGYSDLLYLNNMGTVEKAHIKFYHPMDIHIDYCPVVSQIQHPITQENHYIISPFSSETLEGMGGASMWNYKIQDTSWILVQKDFLQESTIDLGIGANPAFVLNTTTHLWDFVIGNYVNSKKNNFASLHYYKNTGTFTQPSYKLQDLDYAKLSSLHIQGASPCFGDIDGDGEMEMLVGTKNGRIILIKNEVIVDTFYQNIQVGEFAAPQLVDLNEDGLLDLIIGEKRKVWASAPKNITKGNINYFKNTGSLKTPKFTLITDSLGGVDAIDRNFSNFGYARPCFYKNAEGKFELLCGSENGEMEKYSNISNNLKGIFDKINAVSVGEHILKVGIHSAPTLADINGDGYLDLLVGNLAGGVQLFYGGKTDIGITPRLPLKKLHLSPNPSSTYLNIPSQYVGLPYVWINFWGIKIQEGKLNSEYLDTSHLLRGVYILKIGTLSFKIILI